MELYIAEVQNEIEKNIPNDKDYVKVGSILMSDDENIETGRTKLTYKLNNGKSNGKFRLAYKDTGSCMAVGPISVTYNYCKSATKALSKFPATFVAEKQVFGQCVDNAKRSNDQDLLMTCDGQGFWKDMEGGCSCEKGYGPVRGDLECRGK